MKKRWILLIAVLLLIGFAFYEEKSSAQMLKPLKAGSKALGFSLRGLDGKRYSVNSFLRELGNDGTKPVIINFWASWCGPCQQEAPELVRLFEKYKDRVTIYAVNVTYLDTAERARRFSEQYRLPFPVLLDREGTVSEKYGIRPIPTTFFIDRNGVIANKIEGMLNETQFEKILLNLL